jgi:hypothetical protein
MDSYFVTFKGQQVRTSPKPRLLLLVENNFIEIFDSFKSKEGDVRNSTKVEERESRRGIVTFFFAGVGLEGSQSLCTRPSDRISMKATLELREFKIRGACF